MKRIATIAVLAGALMAPAAAQAHPLSCDKARAVSGHSWRVSCVKSSENHAWLNYRTWIGKDHVYQSHSWDCSWWQRLNWQSCHKIVVVHGPHGY